MQHVDALSRPPFLVVTHQDEINARSEMAFEKADATTFAAETRASRARRERDEQGTPSGSEPSVPMGEGARRSIEGVNGAPETPNARRPSRFGVRIVTEPAAPVLCADGSRENLDVPYTPYRDGTIEGEESALATCQF